MEFPTNTLEKAVSEFYQSNVNIQDQAHEWLKKAKSSSEAWVFVWKLLKPQKTSEAQFFAANTLYLKIKNSFDELTLENIIGLREKLLTTIFAYNSGPKVVLNRLCICLSAYFFQTYPDNWPDALPSLLLTFTPENFPQISADKVLWILFEILTVLSDEFSVMDCQHHKGRLVKHHLIENTSLVVGFIEKVLLTYMNQEMILQALKCLSSWANIGTPINEYQNLSSILVNLVFSSYKCNTSICEQALECLNNIIDIPENCKFPTFLLEFLTKILPLGKIVSKELTLEEPIHQGIISNIYNLFLTFGATHSRQCLNWIKQGESAREQVLTLVSYALRCSGAEGFYPIHETYSTLAFGFWYVLQDEILLSPSKDRELYMKYFGPVYNELVNILITKAQLPDQELHFTKQDLEAFRCYRQDISDTLMYCHSILHETIISIIQSKLQKIDVNKSKWQELEACLFSLCSISENVDMEENNFLPVLFHYIRNLPFERLDRKVFSTALNTIGAYAGWISAHNSTLEHTLPLIILGLNVPETTSSATMALKDLVRDCQMGIKPYSSLILDASQKALHGGRLTLNDSQRLMCTVGLLLSVLSLDTIIHYLNLILTPYMDQLGSLALQEPSPLVKTNILFCLKLIGVLSATLNTKFEDCSENSQTNQRPTSNEPQPVLLILHKLLPVIKLIANSWSQEEQIMKSLYVVLKQSVTNLLEETESVVTEILDFIVSTYRINPHPAALDLSKTVSTLFGKDEKYQTMFQFLTKELSSVALSKLSKAQSLSDHTDLIEALFTYLAQILKKIPKLIIDSDSVSLFQCATITLAIPELPTAKAAASFLANFILQSVDCDILTSVVNNCGQQLVLQIISCIGGEASRSYIAPLASILLSLNKNYCENHSKWLREAVTESLCPRTNCQQRENFVRTVLTIQKNREQLQEIVRKFYLICRGIVGTEYAQSVTPYF